MRQRSSGCQREPDHCLGRRHRSGQRLSSSGTDGRTGLLENLDAIGVTENIGSFTADAGYFSEENVTSLEANERIDAMYIATGRMKHHEQVPDAPKGHPPKGLTTKERMARKLRTKRVPRGIRSPESDRGTAVRPDRTLPGLPAVHLLSPAWKQMQGEWKLVCLTHNLLRCSATERLANRLRNSNRGSLHLSPRINHLRAIANHPASTSITITRIPSPPLASSPIIHFVTCPQFRTHS